MRDRFSSFWRSAAVIVLAMTVAGCGTATAPATQGLATTTGATPVPVVTATTAATPVPLATASPTTTPVPTVTVATTATPVVEATPTPVLSASVNVLAIGMRDMRDLTWGSSLIVHGTVAEKLPSARFPAADGPLGTMTPQDYYDLQIYTDYVIDVDRVLRGQRVGRVTLREQGGQVDGVLLDATAQYPELHAGDDLVLFLMHGYPEKSGDALWATGVSQGIWLSEGDTYAPYHGQFGSLDLAGVGLAVADALRQGPPEHLPLPLIPLEQSPLGPDLPTSATPSP